MKVTTRVPNERMNTFDTGCHWVMNARAAGGKVTLHRGRRHHCQLVEVPVDERPAIIKRYLEKVPGGRPHIPVDRHAPVGDFVAIADRFPVFRVDRLRA